MSNGLVNVVIGLALMYLLLSLICTIANEYVSKMMNWRAKTLSKGIRDLIDDPQLQKIFLDHGLIQTANKSADKPDGASYLSARSVALALLDSLSGDPEANAKADDAKPKIPTIADLKAYIEKLPRSNVKDVLVTAVSDAGEDIEKLRIGVAAWFDDSMDRMSGIYKRKLQLFSFLAGLVIAVVLNADTVVVAHALWSDSDLRANIGKTAETTIKNGEPTLTKTDLDTLLKTLRPLPIGWAGAAGPAEFSWGVIGSAGLKVFGWLLTALALSLGAPFWFDTLNKVMNIRTTGVKPAPETPKP